MPWTEIRLYWQRRAFGAVMSAENNWCEMWRLIKFSMKRPSKKEYCGYSGNVSHCVIFWCCIYDVKLTVVAAEYHFQVHPYENKYFTLAMKIITQNSIRARVSFWVSKTENVLLVTKIRGTRWCFHLSLIKVMFARVATVLGYLESCWDGSELLAWLSISVDFEYEQVAYCSWQ